MKTTLFISAFVGVVVATFMMYVAWEHNPQQIVHSEDAIHYGYLISIGASWFIVTFLSIFLLFMVIRALWRFFRSSYYTGSATGVEE